ncbi:hypothetical protein Tco_1033593 [Tanacetum coccineum]
MHNNIMAARSRDRPPMLATRRYAQWQSCFLRYIDTRPNGDALRKCILEERSAVETILNMSPENKAHYETEKGAIHLLLTGIGDEIYSTVDACKTAHDMWIAIERLQQESMESYYSRFYKMMNEMIRNNLTVSTMQVNVQFLQQLQLEWSRFIKIVKQHHDLDTVSYHKLFDVLKQYQKEVNEIRAERIAKNANPLALVVVAQQYLDPYYQAPKSHKSYTPPSKQSSSTRSHASTKYKGKQIAKPITPPSKSASKEDNDPEQAQRDKDMKPKREKDYMYHKEKMLMCKQAKKGVPLQAEQAKWIADTDEEIDEQELEAHYSYMAKIQEVPTADLGTDTEPVEKVQYNAEYNVFANKRQHSKQSESISNTCVVEMVDSNVIADSPDMCDNDIQKHYDNERVMLANLIANLTLDTEENKKILKQLKKENASLTQELKECQT